MLSLGDFFKSAPHALPVNPKPVEFTCVAKGSTLPGGEPNKTGRPVRARIKGAFIFLDGNETQAARAAARRDARDRASREAADDEMPEPVDAGDVQLDLVYQVIHRALREWDDEAKRAGGPLFPSADLARELLVPREANRLFTLYNEYVAAEHPEGPPTEKTFRGTKGRGAQSSER